MRKKNDLKILIVAYYFHPYSGVGAKRPSYWYERLRQEGIDAYVATATPQINANKRVTVVAPGKNQKYLIRDEGVNWSEPLRAFFKKNNIKFDIILFTGGPFMHFNIISKIRNLKTCIQSRFILDFRDPFAYNPRFKNTWLKKNIKRFYERKFINSVDHVITVNDYCASLLNVEPKKCTIINNGFDERVTANIEEYSGPLVNHQRINVVYAGSFAKDRNPNIFLSVLSSLEQIRFHHIGNQEHDFQISDSYVTCHGVVSYEKTIAILKSCQIGVIFTSGHPFESTTKIFDYMACNLVILIISDSGLPQGSLYEITKDYGKAIWVNNNIDDISNFFERKNFIELLNYQLPDMYPYSREAGFHKLLKVIKNVLT